MRRTYLFLLLFFVFATKIFAQNLEAQWHNSPINNSERVNHQTIANDDNLILVGQTAHTSQPHFDALLMMIDTTGKVLLKKTYDFGGYDAFNFVHVLADGQLLISGQTEQSDSENIIAWIIKLDASGDVLWKFELKKYNIEQITRITPDPSGGYWFGGNTIDELLKSGIFCGKIDSDGKLLEVSDVSILEPCRIAELHVGGDGKPLVVAANEIFNTKFHLYKLVSNKWKILIPSSFTTNFASGATLEKNNTFRIVIDKSDRIHVFFIESGKENLQWRNFDLNGNLIEEASILTKVRGLYGFQIIKLNDGSLDFYLHKFEFDIDSIFKLEQWNWKGRDNETLIQSYHFDEVWSAFNSIFYRFLPIQNSAPKKLYLINENDSERINVFKISASINNELSIQSLNLAFVNPVKQDEFIIQEFMIPNDGGWLIVNKEDNYHYLQSIYLQFWRYNSSGEITGKYKISSNSNYAINTIVSIAKSKDNGLIILGYFDILQAPVLIKMEANGTIAWEKIIQDVEINKFLSKVLVRQDGKIIVGTDMGMFKRYTLYIFDENGNFTGLRRLGDVGDNIINISLANDGTLIAWGYSLDANFYPQTIFFRTNGLYETVLKKENPLNFGIDFVSNYQNPFFETIDGNFIALTGNLFDTRIRVIKFKRNGLLVWMNNFDASNNTSPLAYQQLKFAQLKELSSGFLLLEAHVRQFNDYIRSYSRLNRNDYVHQHYFDEGPTVKSNVIQFFPTFSQSNPDFLPNYTSIIWSDGFHEKTRDVVRIRQTTTHRPDELPPANRLHFWGNPSRNLLSFSLSDEKVGQVSIEIWNANGQLMHQFFQIKNNHQFDFQWNSQYLSAGGYVVVVYLDGKRWSGKWIKLN